MFLKMIMNFKLEIYKYFLFPPLMMLQILVVLAL